MTNASVRFGLYLLVVAALLGMHALTVATGECHGSAVGVHNSQLPMSSEPSSHTAMPAAQAGHVTDSTTAHVVPHPEPMAQNPGMPTMTDQGIEHASGMLCAVVLIVGALALLGIRPIRLTPVARRTALPRNRMRPLHPVPVFLRLLNLRL